MRRRLSQATCFYTARITNKWKGHHKQKCHQNLDFYLGSLTHWVKLSEKFLILVRILFSSFSFREREARYKVLNFGKLPPMIIMCQVIITTAVKGFPTSIYKQGNTSGKPHGLPKVHAKVSGAKAKSPSLCFPEGWNWSTMLAQMLLPKAASASL